MDVKHGSMVQKKTFKKQDLLLYFSVLCIYFFYMKSGDKILNYPSWITYSLLISLTIIIFFRSVFLRRENSDEGSTQVFLLVFARIIKSLVLAWFIAGIILIPFNYYNIYSSESNSLETMNCKITGLSTYSKNRTIFFILDGKTNTIYGYKPIMEEIRLDGKYRDYQLVAQVREGLLNSYILEHWEIEKK